MSGPRLIGMAAVVVLLGVGEGNRAHAHDVPARRAVAVQLDTSSGQQRATVLVTWTSARGPQGGQLLARASWGRGGRKKDALRTLAAVEALRGLAIQRDGIAIDSTTSQIETKVRIRGLRGTGGEPVRVFSAVMITIPLPPGSELTVTRTRGALTRFRWLEPNGVISQRSANRPHATIAGERTSTPSIRVVVPKQPAPS